MVCPHGVLIINEMHLISSVWLLPTLLIPTEVVTRVFQWIPVKSLFLMNVSEPVAGMSNQITRKTANNY